MPCRSPNSNAVKVQDKLLAGMGDVRMRSTRQWCNRSGGGGGDILWMLQILPDFR